MGRVRDAVGVPVVAVLLRGMGLLLGLLLGLLGDALTSAFFSVFGSDLAPVPFLPSAMTRSS